MKAIYPGSFDPLTLGHLDIIKRASTIFDYLVVLVSKNPDKTEKLDCEVRIALIEEAVKKFKNVDVKSFTGLTVQYALEHKYHAILRGIRGAGDFESELEMSQTNKALANGLETVFLMTSPEFSFIRSSRVWELLQFNGNIEHLVPINVKNYLLANKAAK